MKNFVIATLTSIIMTFATAMILPRLNLPFDTYSGDVVKDTSTKVIQERIEEYKKVSNVESDVTRAIETGGPSVVSIITTKELESYLTDPFTFFFWLRPEKTTKITKTTTQKVKVGGGSGIIISKDGYIITNKHVISDTTAQYTVVTSDGDALNVKKVWLDPVLDIAVMQVTDNTGSLPTDLQPATFISYKSPVHIGQFTIAIGNALAEYSNTATFGIISAKNRSVDTQQTDTAYIGLYQTDAPINPWNSGGPLLNTAWEVIGMNTAVSQGEWIGFALPLTNEFIQATLSSLQEDGTISRPYIWIQSKVLSKSAARNLNMTKFEWLYVQSSQTASPALRAGIGSGDVITEINGTAVQNDMPLLYTLYTYKPWDIISLLIYKNKEYKKIDVTLTALSSIAQ